MPPLPREETLANPESAPEMTRGEHSGTTHMADLHAISGPPRVVNEGQGYARRKAGAWAGAGAEAGRRLLHRKAALLRVAEVT